MTIFGNVLSCSVDHFDCLDSKNRPILAERDILRNLKAIVADADQTPANEVRVIMHSLESVRLMS